MKPLGERKEVLLVACRGKYAVLPDPAAELVRRQVEVTSRDGAVATPSDEHVEVVRCELRIAREMRVVDPVGLVPGGVGLDPREVADARDRTERSSVGSGGERP
jgi:hypothetical protein